MSSKPKILVAVVTCHRHRDRADAQRRTWVPEAKALGMDVLFFVGRGVKREEPERDDEVVVGADDSYEGLPHKVRAVCQWALEQEYDYVFKMDDDTYLRPDRLLACGFEGRDYSGRLRGPSGDKPYPYASGFSYWLSNRAVALVAFTVPYDVAEDRHVGNTIYGAGLKCYPDYRYVVVKSDGNRNALSGSEGPRANNDVISAGELSPEEMELMHLEFHEPSAPLEPLEGEFSGLSVMVKTFLRDGMLFKTAEAIPECLPGAKIIVVDDGYESKKKVTRYSEMRRAGHVCQWLPFDSGFCAKSNEAVRLLDREFMLIASDDFDFGQRGVKSGVRKMMSVLRHNPEIGVAAGRVGDSPYEGFILREGSTITEVQLTEDNSVAEVTPDGVEFRRCDIAVNYCVVRRKVFERSLVKWDERYKIGGDHFEFYDQVRKAGWDVAFVPGANIEQMQFDHSLVHSSYAKYRARARQALPLFFDKYGLTRYTAFDGRADVLLPDGRIVSEGQTGPDPATKKRTNVFIATERLYKTKDGVVVGPLDPRPKTLLVAKGCTMPWAQAKELGLC